ncbi:uncharacterized protein [Nicotiana sylvestris]|uniref:uncharacterized protein n=1 Tax=Nicotiana sylvestris TaxID=4096 RepID=UPI00388C598C
MDLCLSGGELVKILPDSWIINYEKLREPEESLQSGEQAFTKRDDKTVFISFDHSNLKKPNKTIFSCQMIQPKDTTDTYPEPDGEEGKRAWWFKCPFTGHCPWDLDSDCQDCLEDPIGEYDEHHQRHWERFGLNKTKPKSKKKGKTTEKQFRAKYENKDPSIGSLSHPDFPSLQPFEKEGISRAPKIPKKNIVLPTGEKPPTSDIEASMKWQSENSIYQNKVLNNIDNTIKNVSHTQNKMMSKVETIEKKMEQISSHYAGLIKALGLRLANLQYEIFPPGTSLFQFFQQQQKETISI